MTEVDLTARAATRGGAAGFTVSVEEQDVAAGVAAAHLPGQIDLAAAVTSANVVSNWNRFYDQEQGGYLAPDPIMQSPYRAVAGARRGAETPAYAYAVNAAPVRVFDSAGAATDEQLAFESEGRTWAGAATAKGTARALESLSRSDERDSAGGGPRGPRAEHAFNPPGRFAEPRGNRSIAATRRPG